MGENFKQAGFKTLDTFVAAMNTTLEAQTSAFVSIVAGDSRLLKALQQKQWTDFAARYNGSGYATNAYDVKMKQNYEKLTQAAPAAKPAGT